MKSKKPPRKELDKLYWEEGHSPSQIARAYDVHPSTVREWLIEKNIRLKTISEAKMQKGVKKPPKRELQRLYHTENLSTRNIGERYDVSYKTVSKWLKIDGIKIKTKSEASLPNGVKKPTERELKRCIDDEMPLTDIARNYGVHPKTVATWMDSMEIKRKRIKRNTKDGEWKDLEYALEQAIFQSDLIEKTGFGKAKMTRIIDRLEGKNLVERKRRGMTNVVVIKQHT